MKCPRRNEGFNSSVFKLPLEDTWGNDNTCSFCGSLNPDDFLARIRAGDVEIEPTDKNYKAYLRNAGGALFKQTYRDCYNQQEEGERPCQGPLTCTHWVTRDIGTTKFYYPHLSEDQMKEFVELYNSGRMKIGYPGYFYVLPYFMRIA